MPAKYYYVKLAIATIDNLDPDAPEKIRSAVLVHLAGCRNLFILAPPDVVEVTIPIPSATPPETPAPSDRKPDEPETSG